tara:strand:+ start:767 stop:1840 length:1074 start_codon:yes stop_codon:yes gene_type:complete
MAYSSIAKPTDYFNTVLYNGTGSSNSVTGVGYQPDWTWIKQRNGTTNHFVYDGVRGVQQTIYTDATSAEATQSQGLTAFGTDGFTVGTNTGVNGAGGTGGTYVAWNWLAANGTASNSDGSISSTVSANTTAGFSIVSYTGGGANATVGHGLGAAPKVVIIKQRTDAGYNWVFGSDTLTSWEYILKLNLTDAEATGSGPQSCFNSTAPTSTVFSIGTSHATSGSGDSLIAYCFVEKQGYSKFGSYIGNGNADGTFVYTGFKPAFVLLKKTSGGTARNWCILDNKREGFNPENDQLHSNTTGAESMGSGTTLDLLSNGFKLRVTDDDKNENGNPYIYMAFAENPFVGNDSGTAVPVTAR